MRRVALVLLAACGRIGFDGGGSATPDAGAADATGTPALCDVRDVATLSLDSGAKTLRSLATESGFVVAIETTSGNVYVARVAENLNDAALHLPLTPNYALGGLSTIGDRIFIHASSDGVGYLKLLDPSFDTYATVEDGDDLLLDPATAPGSRGTGWRLNVTGGILDVQEMMADGTRSGLVSSFAPAVQTATIDANRVVAVIGNDCKTYLLDDTGNPQQLHAIAGCSEPQLAVLDDGRALIAIRIKPTEMVMYRVPPDSIASGASLSLGDARAARVVAAETTAWVIYTRGGAVELARYDAELGPPAFAQLPMVSSPYDLARNAVFWLAGTTLRVGTPCLR